MLLRNGWCSTVLMLAAILALPNCLPAADKQSAQSTVPVFRLHGELKERPDEQTFSLDLEPSPALKDLVQRLERAGEDDTVGAVVLTLDDAQPAVPQIEELRQAVGRIRAAGKEVYAHADSLTMSGYALLCGASQLSVVPTGDLWLTGVYGESPYLRGLLDKLGVTPDFLTCGKYKSAAEMFMREGPSAEAEEMQNWLLDGVFETQLKLIAAGRRVDVAQVRQWIDGGPYTAAKAKELGLIDAVEQRHEFEARLREKLGDNVKFAHKYGRKTQPQIDLSNPLAAVSHLGEILGGPKMKTYKDSVAIVYVDGPITLGDTASNPLSAAAAVAASTPIRKALDKAADDETVKAVVLRVNSPGGSATASDVILAATKRVKAKKPLVVSMGDVAASGGYYVSCGADTIFADEATITGSVGVVGGKLATTGLWNHLGVTWKGYRRGAHAAMLSSAAAFSPEEREKMQSWMDEIYGVFKGHVTAIRGQKLAKPIDDLAGGRVYTGRQALDLGLVDKIGTMADAIRFAAAEAKLEKYDVRVVPEPKSLLETLIEDISGGKDDSRNVFLGGQATDRGQTLLIAALPYLGELDPVRLSAVLLALRQLEMLHDEGAVLMMPPLVIGQ